MNRRKSLKHKIILVMMPMTLLLIFLNSLYHYIGAKERMIKDFEDAQLSAEAHLIDTLYLIDAGYRMLEIKLESELNEKADAFLLNYEKSQGQLMQRDLEALKKSYGNAYDFMMIDQETTVFLSTLPEGLGFNFMKFSSDLGEKINLIREGDETWFEQLRTNVVTGKLSKFAYIPTKDHKVLLEVAYSTDGFKNMAEELKPHSFIEQMIDASPHIKDIKIYDVYGYLYSDSGEKVEPTQELLHHIQQVKKEKVVTLPIDKLYTKKYIYVDLNQYRQKTLADTDRIIEILYDKTIINDSLADLTFSTITGMMIISVFLALSIMYLSDKLTKPIESLRLSAQKIANGDYSSRVSIFSDDEVGQLSETFNYMAEALDKNFNQIEGQKKGLEEYTKNLERNVTLLENVNGLMDISKLEEGKSAAKSIPFSMDEVFEMVLNQAGFKAASKGLALIIQSNPEIPKRLMGDPIRLKQVLLNLIYNAIRCSDKGEIIVEIHLEEKLSKEINAEENLLGDETKEEGLKVRFSVKDSRSVMEKGEAEMSLSLCKPFVQLMNGDIWVENNLHGGSVFFFTAIFKPVEGVSN